MNWKCNPCIGSYIIDNWLHCYNLAHLLNLFSTAVLKLDHTQSSGPLCYENSSNHLEKEINKTQAKGNLINPTFTYVTYNIHYR